MRLSKKERIKEKETGILTGKRRRRRRRGEPGGSNRRIGGVDGREDIEGREDDADNHSGVNCQKQWLRISSFLKRTPPATHFSHLLS